MNGFIRCCIFLTVIGIAFFFVGRIVPKRWFRYDKFPFRLYQFEHNGNIYIKTGIRKWKGILPDMSEIVPKLIPSKKLPTSFTAETLEEMIQETCIAEWVHNVLGLLGFGCIFIWKGIGGVIVSILYFIGNLPYVWIQRYNRPKIVRLWQKQKEKEDRHQMTEQEWTCEESDYTQRQYGTRA